MCILIEKLEGKEITKVDLEYVNSIKYGADKIDFWFQIFAKDMSLGLHNIFIQLDRHTYHLISESNLVQTFLELYYGGDVRDFIMNSFINHKVHTEIDLGESGYLNYTVRHYLDKGVIRFSIVNCYGDEIFWRDVESPELNTCLNKLLN